MYSNNNNNNNNNNNIIIKEEDKNENKMNESQKEEGIFWAETESVKREREKCFFSFLRFSLRFNKIGP